MLRTVGGVKTRHAKSHACQRMHAKVAIQQQTPEACQQSPHAMLPNLLRTSSVPASTLVQLTERYRT